MDQHRKPSGLLISTLIIEVTRAVAYGKLINSPLSSYHIPATLMEAICKEERLLYRPGVVELMVAGIPVRELKLIDQTKVWMNWDRLRDAAL